jgi:hypothetical protein
MQPIIAGGELFTRDSRLRPRVWASEEFTLINPHRRAYPPSDRDNCFAKVLISCRAAREGHQGRLAAPYEG